jgi:putative ABC transport system permease protein
MESVRRSMRRLRRLIRDRATEQSMDDELRYHIECETAERIRAGRSPEDARLSALRDFGGLERFKEEARDARGTRPVDDFVSDLRYAARVLRRHPGFTAAAMLTFGLGIGAAGAIFSVVYGVLLRPLPYADPARLVVVWERNIPRGTDRNVVSAGNFETWIDRNHVFDGMAALVPRPVTLVDGAAPERVMGAEVSTGYFRLLGVIPMLGRDFDAVDATVDGGAVVLSHGFWSRRFGADPAVVGRALQISGKPHTIVGVMPASFEPPTFGWLGTQDLWFPFIATPENRAWGRFLLVVARLRRDVSVERARAEMAILAQQMATETPSNKGWGVSVITLGEQIAGDVRTALLVVLGAVGLLLLIAVANVATLTLSLIRKRAQELATRRSLGASDRRLFRQLLTEGGLLGMCGTACGLLTISPAVRVLLSLAPPDVPRPESIHADAPVLLVVTAVAFLATIAFGAVAALRGRSAAISSGLKSVGDTRSAARVGTGGLVAAEIAFALALTVMATLMVRSFTRLRAVDLGFAADGVVAARVALVGPRYNSPASQHAFFDTLLERVRNVPGVLSASLISTRPFGGLGPATEATDPLQSHDAATHSTVADIRYVDATVFQTLRIPVVHGTTFDSNDAAASPPRVVISETLADALWPRQAAVGRRLHLELYGGITAEILGVVRDVHVMDPRTPVRPIAYLSDARFPSDTRDVIVRVNGDPSSLVRSLRTVLAGLEPAVPLYQVTPLPELVDRAVASDRFTTFLLSAFAGLALLLGSVGVFGVISSEVAGRRREIGIRMALGAGTSAVIRMMLTRALSRALWGVSAGSVLALLLAYSMQSLLFGVAPNDPVSFLIVAMLLFCLAAVATLIPTVQAIRSSPLIALREG